MTVPMTHSLGESKIVYIPEVACLKNFYVMSIPVCIPQLLAVLLSSVVPIEITFRSWFKINPFRSHVTSIFQSVIDSLFIVNLFGLIR